MPRAVRSRSRGAAALVLARYYYDFSYVRAIYTAILVGAAVERPVVPDVRFDPLMYPDPNALEDFRFTCDELLQLTHVLLIPNVFITSAGDRVIGVEALAMLCYRLSYPGKLSRIRKQFGRSDPSCSRIITDLYCFLDNEWKDTLFFNDRVYYECHETYRHAVEDKVNGIVDRVTMFIDGTKAFICRPGKRRRRILAVQDALNSIPVGDRENLQKVCYSGHKRRHCLNYQGVCTPDGLCISFYGPIEGRLHDSTMLRESSLLSYLSSHPIIQRLPLMLYGDPAYGIDERLCSPFQDAPARSSEKQFNELMSKNRVSIEWMFGIIKQKWAFLDWNKKHKLLLTPVGSMLALLLALLSFGSTLFPLLLTFLTVKT
ncbi:hypothetical protein PHMEG_00029570 [Phytophthora megakarya]|uniref:DDE Tnp4 domain-containing protein n=1 Tax=Phytophthora megakarya TaxID=4795 RepID=A0A225V2F3_9STRA|nr:hypothetical protein PHMEG_00029570 [Phytophthora megakarya]